MCGGNKNRRTHCCFFSSESKNISTNSAKEAQGIGTKRICEGNQGKTLLGSIKIGIWISGTQLARSQTYL